jgi:uncharacterized protein (TIGR00375 family)
MDLENMSRCAQMKGIDLLGTGDFTHPVWFAELKSKLASQGNGLYKFNNTNFILTSEVSNIYSKNSKTRKIHTIIFAPSIEAVSKINKELGRLGNVTADGRPIFGFPAEKLVEVCLSVSSDCLIIPAHAWTPWFSIFGSNSGFDSIEECYGDYAKYIYAIETGLSSDPEMNWRLSMLDKITLISNSDAHSPSKLGREANCLDCKMDYFEIIKTIKTKDKNKFLFTLEFFPEEGKYHYDGHRICEITTPPEETKKLSGICPRCKKPLTRGVMYRVGELADRTNGDVSPEKEIPFYRLIPLEEIIAEALGKTVSSNAVAKEYTNLVETLGAELNILLKTKKEDIKKVSSPRIAEGICRMREGKVKIKPGFDGVYGKISIFNNGEEKNDFLQNENQMSLF